MNTSVPSVNTKFDVHWPPSVTVCTPGWMAAVAAGAHVGAAAAGSATATAATAMRTATVMTPSLRNTDNVTSRGLMAHPRRSQNVCVSENLRFVHISRQEVVERLATDDQAGVAILCEDHCRS